MKLLPWKWLANSRDALDNKALRSKLAIDWNIYKLRRKEFSKLFCSKKSICHKNLLQKTVKIHIIQKKFGKRLIPS